MTSQGKELALDIHRRVQAYIERLSEGVSEEEMAAFVSVTSKAMANYTEIGELLMLLSALAPLFFRGAVLLILILTLALGAVLLSHEQAQAQTANVPTVYVFSYQTAAKMGEDASFIFYRTGDISETLSVSAKYRERGIGSGNGDWHDVTVFFPAGARTVDHSLSAEVDMASKHTNLRFDINVEAHYAVGNARYIIDITRSAADPASQPPGEFLHGTYLGITAGQSSVTEGDTVDYTVTRDGDLAGELTVTVVVNDPYDVLLGDYWEHDDGPVQNSMLADLSQCDIPANSTPFTPGHPGHVLIPDLRHLCAG